MLCFGLEHLDFACLSADRDFLEFSALDLGFISVLN